MTKTKRNQRVHVDLVETTIAQLKELDAKPKLELTLRESIAKMEVHLKSAIKKGYDYHDLADVLAQQSILISAATLKQYMKELEQGSSSRNRKKSTPKRSNVPQTNLKLVKSKSSSDSSNSAQAHQGSSQTVPNQVVKVKEKADSTLNTLNTEVKVSSDNREQELVRSQVNNHRTLLEKLQDPSYTPNFDDDEYDDDFHNY